MNIRIQKQIESDNNKRKMESSIKFFNLGFTFIKINFIGTLFMAFIVASLLQLPEEKGICFVFLFSLPMAICMCVCFIISDILLNRWLMTLFWGYGAISLACVLYKSIILEILSW